ncbi:MAG TPA: STAS domain-containing protein [Burkholderiaceae bacterium]
MSDTPNALRIDGDFTIYRAAELAASLKAALAGTPEGGTFEIDLSEVAEMDSAGVQLLLAARRSAADSGRSLRLAGRSAAVDEVLAILRLTGHFGDAVAGTH